MFHFSFTINRKFRLLNQGVSQIGAGNWESRVYLSGHDEFSDLASYFNNMAKTLKENLFSLEKSQADLLQSEKMSAIGQLASGVAHEINNPLGVILGFAQSLKIRFGSDPSLASPIGFIEHEALRCKDIVQNLLTFSRSSQPRNMEPTDVNQLIQSSLPLLEARGCMKGVVLKIGLNEKILLPIINKNQIQQVLINLGNNAMDAMPQGGELRIESGQLEREGKEWVFLSVKDSGMGISDEVLSKIFDPFFTTKEVGKGTGLGLSITSEIIKKHNGKIQVDSEVGKGTKFTVYLPINKDLQKVAT